MIVRYDALDRLEKPKLTLCNPGSKYESGSLSNVVGILADHEAEEIVFNFNALSELNFRLNRLHDYKKEQVAQQAVQETISTNLGAYSLISGEFNGTAAGTYFPGLVGAGADHTQTNTNYYSKGSGTTVVFQYEVPITGIPAGAIIDSVYCIANAHPESASQAAEYMCIQLKSGNVALSEQYNFKNSGSGNHDYTLYTNDIPTVAQLSTMVLECTLGYYGGALNGATCYVEYHIPGYSNLTEDEVNLYKDIDRLYKATLNRRLIFVEDIGYFMITDINEGYDGHYYYKDISAQSIDVELQQKMIPFIEDGTYRFSSDQETGAEGILEKIVSVIPGWTIDYVDESVSSKWRTFEDVDITTNCLAFLVENIQDAYECIVVFDPIYRTVNVYDQLNYVEETNIHITNNDVIDSLEIRESSDDIYTAISVTGSEESLTIAAVNPLGTNTIYNFSYYLDWMTPGLRASVVAWQDAVAEQESNYLDANNDYYHYLSLASTEQFEIDRLRTQITLYQRCRDNITASNNTAYVSQYNDAIESAGGDPIISTQIDQAKAEIDARIAECQSEMSTHEAALENYNASATAIRATIDSIVTSLSIDGYFTSEEIEELQNYIFEGSYTDEYVVVTDIMSYSEQFSQMETMYTRAKQQLVKVSQPTQEFSVDVENFIFAKDFEAWSSELRTGCLISVELTEEDIAKLFLSNITINYDDHSLSMTFGNRFNKFDPKSLFEDVLGSVSKSANTLNYVKDILYPIKAGELDVVKNTLQRSRDLTMSTALSSDKQEVVIDASGYTGREIIGDSGEYDPRQIKITGRNIVFTDDAWETSKTAIGELILNPENPDNTAYGINAELIVGDMIIGEGLRIIGTDADGNPQDLFSIIDNKIETSVSESEYDVLEQVNTRMTSIEQTSSNISMAVTNIQSVVTEDGVTRVKTGSGYTFDDKGLKITDIGDGGSGIQNVITNDGMYVQLVSPEDIGGCRATITSSGNRLQTYVTYNSVRYYTQDDTFTFDAGDTLYINAIGDGDLTQQLIGRGKIIIDDEVVVPETQGGASYTYTMPEKHIDIELRNGPLVSTVIITTRNLGNPTNVLTATDDGVDAINLTAHNYLTIGRNSRFEDYPDPHNHNMTRTACYLITTGSTSDD